jgi:transposase
MRKAYLSDLSDAEWVRLEHHLPAPKVTGRPRLYPPREILDASFFCVLKSGCSLRRAEAARPRPFYLPLFTVVRGRRILGRSL